MSSVRSSPSETRVVPSPPSGRRTRTTGRSPCPTTSAFQSIVSSFARFEYPDKWQSLDSVIEKNGEESPICVKEFAGKYELEEFLYDENSFPRYTFTFDRDGSLSVCSENTYSELDAFGNALNIKVKTPNGSYTIRRTIEYR